MACVGRPPLGCRTPAGRAALQLLGGWGWAQGSRPQRRSEPCLPGALVPQTRLPPARLPLDFALPPSAPHSWRAACNPNLSLTSPLQSSVSLPS